MDELETALSILNFPLVVKTAEDHHHKSDVGGVRLNIAERGEAYAAYQEMSARIGPRALIMEMAPSGIELSVGCICDRGFGPVIILSAGGL